MTAAPNGLRPIDQRPAIPGGPRSVAAVLDDVLAADPGREALVGRSGRLAFATLDEYANRAANALRTLGVGQGDRVAACLPNDVDIVIAFLGAMRAGAIWLGISRSLAPPEKAYLVDDSGASLVISESTDDPGPVIDLEDWRDEVTAARKTPLDVEIDPHAPAAIAYTSGTTGHPKGAVHSQHNLLLPGAVAAAGSDLFRADMRIGVCLPLTVLNLMALAPLVAFQVGTTCVCIDRVDALGLAGWIHDEKVGTFSAVPAIVHDLLTDPGVRDSDLASLVRPGVGGADTPESFKQLYRERFGTEMTTGYGLTEAPTAVTIEDPTQPRVPGSCGRAMPHVDVFVVNEAGERLRPGEPGEVCVAAATEGPFAGVYTPMLGYWNQPAATDDALRGGFLHTGDVGVFDADGNLFIKDRKADLIIRGGANVYPAEVERVLHDDPRVTACAVVGQPDERLGERVVAFIQAAPDADTAALLADLGTHCAANLAKYKVPERFELVDGFTRTPMGKIRRGELRARLRG